MTDTQVSPDREQLDGGATRVAPSPRGSTRRFRGATYEDAVDAATEELGPDIHVLEANRIRRGGLGGFFATDLGVEVTVTTEELSGGPIEGAGGAIGPDETNEIDASAIRPYLPEDLTTDRGDGALPGQSLGMTDARLEQLLDRANRTEREQLPRRRPAAALPSFADHYAAEILSGDEEAAALTGPIPLVDEATATAVGQSAMSGPEGSVDAGVTDEAITDAAATGADLTGADLTDTVNQAHMNQAHMDQAHMDQALIDQSLMGDTPMVPGGDRPRLPAVSLAAVARSAPHGFLDEYPPDVEVEADVETDIETDIDADAGDDADVDAPASVDGGRAPHDALGDIDVASLGMARGVEGEQPIAEMQDLVIDMSAGTLHGTVDVVDPENADKTTPDALSTAAGGAPVVGLGLDPTADPGRAIDQSGLLGRSESMSATTPDGATPSGISHDVDSSSGMSRVLSSAISSATSGAMPTLPADPTMPMTGTVRSAAGDLPAAAASDNDDTNGDTSVDADADAQATADNDADTDADADAEIDDADRTAAGARSALAATPATSATPAVDDSGHPVAVVVPMRQTIDEPMNPIVEPPPAGTGVDVAGRGELAADQLAIDEALAASATAVTAAIAAATAAAAAPSASPTGPTTTSPIATAPTATAPVTAATADASDATAGPIAAPSEAVGAGSPSDVIGAPIVLGGPEFPTGSSDLVAEATERLMGQLGHLATGDGGLSDLDRVRVEVTSADGRRVEMAVERGNAHD